LTVTVPKILRVLLGIAGLKCYFIQLITSFTSAFYSSASLFLLYISNSFHSDYSCLLYITQSHVISFFHPSLCLCRSCASPAARHLVSPFPRRNPLTPLFPQCDTVLEFSTTFSICYRDTAKVLQPYGNKGLRHKCLVSLLNLIGFIFGRSEFRTLDRNWGSRVDLWLLFHSEDGRMRPSGTLLNPT
jgi:hypothetical protein